VVLSTLAQDRAFEQASFRTPNVQFTQKSKPKPQAQNRTGPSLFAAFCELVIWHLRINQNAAVFALAFIYNSGWGIVADSSCGIYRSFIVGSDSQLSCCQPKAVYLDWPKNLAKRKPRWVVLEKKKILVGGN